VAAAGLRARGPFSHAANQAAAGASGTTLAIALSTAEGVAVIAFLTVLASIRPRRKPKRDEEPPRPNIPWWAKALAVTAALAALVAPFAVLFSRKLRPLTTKPLSASAPGAGTGSLRTTPPPSAPIWPVIVGMVLAIAIVLTLTLLARRTRPGPAETSNRNRMTRLLDSLAAGSAALTAVREPRAAIIACYTAMERGFAAAGPAAAPAAADTPAEVLARASRAGIVSAGPAETLTGLFRLARYSTQPVTSADSRVAAQALTEMRTDLESKS
jgi:hypothetical protein